jgi:hypothetical protein
MRDGRRRGRTKRGEQKEEQADEAKVKIMLCKGGMENKMQGRIEKCAMNGDRHHATERERSEADAMWRERGTGNHG